MGVGSCRPRMLPRRNYAYENGGPGMRCQRGVCYIENVSPMKSERIPVEIVGWPLLCRFGRRSYSRASRKLPRSGDFQVSTLFPLPKSGAPLGKQSSARCGLRKAAPFISR